MKAQEFWARVAANLTGPQPKPRRRARPRRSLRRWRSASPPSTPHGADDEPPHPRSHHPRRPRHRSSGQRRHRRPHVPEAPMSTPTAAADRHTALRITQTVPGGLMPDAIAQALADERDRARAEEPRVAPGWLLAAIADARGTHDCPVCNAGRPIPDGVTCPLCAGWTTI